MSTKMKVGKRKREESGGKGKRGKGKHGKGGSSADSKALVGVGPAFAPRTVINDEWQTCKESWAAIAHLFKHYKKANIWQPFFYDGMCSQYLKELGFSKVTHMIIFITVIRIVFVSHRWCIQMLIFLTK